MQELVDRRVLVTGAGSGLGRALALQFSAAGCKVACSDVRPAAAAETLALIQARGGSGLAAALDVRSEEAFAAVIAQLQQAWGGLDVLVNNAGVATAGTVAESPIEQWRFALEINLLGCVRGARAALPLLQAQGRGHIVNVASFAGVANPPAMASYNASKAAVISLSETLRLELAGSGIGVSVAVPSFFKTDLLNSGRGEIDEAAHSTAPQMNRIVERLMEKASVTADDVARDILDAVRRNRFLVMTHPDARLRDRIKRYAPGLYYRLARKATASFLRSR